MGKILTLVNTGDHFVIQGVKGAWVLDSKSEALRAVYLLIVNKEYRRVHFLKGTELRKWKRVEDPSCAAEHKALLRAMSDNGAVFALAPWISGSETKLLRMKLPKAPSNSRIVVCADGSCLGNPGFGGWAWSSDDHEESGSALKVTNNVMELEAAIRALSWYHKNNKDAELQLVTDSMYVVNGLTKWRHSWAKKQYQGIANADQWKKLIRLYSLLDVEVMWVKGHAGHPGNEKVDKLARAAAERAKRQKP